MSSERWIVRYEEEKARAERAEAQVASTTMACNVAVAQSEKDAARAERYREALDVLSRWPPGEGMLEMCQFARRALSDSLAEGDDQGKYGDDRDSVSQSWLGP